MGEACLQETTWMENNVFAGTTGIEPATQAWYALKVRTGGELNTAAALEYRGYAPYCPTLKERRRYKDRMVTVNVPAFPGYLFCQFNARKKVPVLETPGVDYIVGVAGAPQCISDEEMKDIQRVIAAGGAACAYLTRGQRVRVTHGGLTGVEGILVRDEEADRLVVSIEILARSVSLHIDKDKVRAIN